MSTAHKCRRCRIEVPDQNLAISTCVEKDCPLNADRQRAILKAQADAKPQPTTPLEGIWYGG